MYALSVSVAIGASKQVFCSDLSALGKADREGNFVGSTSIWHIDLVAFDSFQAYLTISVSCISLDSLGSFSALANIC